VPAFSSLPSGAVPFISAPTCRRFDEPKWRSCEGQEATRGAKVVFPVRKARAHVRRVIVEAAILYGRRYIQVECQGAQGVTIDRTWETNAHPTNRFGSTSGQGHH